MTQQEAVWILPLIMCAGDFDHPVRCHEGERIPTVIAPGVASLLRLFKDDVFSPQLLQIIACGQSCLSTANNNGFDYFHVDTLCR